MTATPTNPSQTQHRPTRPRRWGWPLFFLVVIGFSVYFYFRSKASANAENQIVHVAVAQIGTARKAVSATGTLQPWSTVDIKSKAGGRVDEMDVEVGSMVKPGQILAKIDPTDSVLTYNQSKADIDSAKAKESQSEVSYQLQLKQSQSSIVQARASLTVAQASLRAATARKKSAQEQFDAQPQLTSATIAQSQANYDSAVQTRTQLTATQEQDRAATRSSYDQAVANNRNAQANLVRIQALVDKGYVATSSLDQAQANARVAAAAEQSSKTKLDTLANEQKAIRESQDARVRQAAEQLRQAKSQVDVQTKRNALDEAIAAEKQAIAQVDQAEATLKQAQANIANNQIKDLDKASARAGTLRAEAALTNAKATLDQTVVRSPSGGIVLQKYVEQGTIITSGLSLNSTGASIVQIGDITKMYVYVLVDETDIANVKVGQKVKISFDAYPDTSFSGLVARIDPQAQVQQNVTSVGVRVEVDNSSPKFKQLKPNLNATCEFIVDEKQDVLTVPSEAVHTEGSMTYVDVVPNGAAQLKANGNGASSTRRSQGSIKNAKYVRRPVEVGFRGDDSVEIVSGLKEGEVIVLQTVSAAASTRSGTTSTSTQARGAVGGMGGPGGGGSPPGGR